jgi:hypothetical protein
MATMRRRSSPRMTMGEGAALNYPRHCERSEAIQFKLAASGDWIASSLSLLAKTR